MGAQALEDHEPVAPHEQTTAEKVLTDLNLQLLDTDNVESRQNILQTIYDTEQEINSNFRPDHFSTEPVDLIELQRDLSPSELLLEYVLDEPNSYVLAITRTTVKRYTLKAKSELEREATDYRSTVIRRKTDIGLAQQLFNDLVKPVSAYKQEPSIIVVPDGKLHLLPFSASSDAGPLRFGLPFSNGGSIGDCVPHSPASRAEFGSRAHAVSGSGRMDH